MTPRSLSPLVLIAAMGVGLIIACSSGSSRDDGVYVPATWQAARTVTGHRVHVLEKQIRCSSCHELKDGRMGDVAPARCASCHEKQSGIRHAAGAARARFGGGAQADCTACHAFAAPIETPLADGGAARPAAPSQLPSRNFLDVDAGATPAFEPAECLRCHSTARGDVPPVVVHGQGAACLKCHRPHDEAKPRAAPCFECHAAAEFAHAAHGGESGCKGCHSHQHGKAAEALGGCQSCHATRHPIVPRTALFEGGHAQCESCHAPHSFEKGLAKPCASCHQGVHALGEAAVPAHRECKSCHSPHDVRGSAAAACSTCHAGVHPDHPRPASGKGTARCIDCHTPHPSAGAGAHDTARPCSSCHAGAGSESGFHRGTACTACHRPHDFDMEAGERTACHRCHEAQFVHSSSNAGHRDCAACHQGLPHEPSRGGRCESCHAAEHAKARAGHHECTTCHEPHAGSLQKECAACHSGEAQTAPAGHRECTKCHEQHSGAPERAACAGCHAAEAGTKHGHVAGECASCHAPHGPKGPVRPPPCASCHDARRLPGLHTAGKHTSCSNCHGGHDASDRAFRAQCLACHTERKDHYPDAASCAACHLFEAKAP